MNYQNLHQVELNSKLLNMNNNVYYFLPQEVSNVSHLIKISHGEKESFIDKTIPKKDLDEDLKYKTYSFHELIDRNKSLRNKFKRKNLNYKQRKALFDVRNEKFDFKHFEEINKLWHSYFDSILSEVRNKGDELKLARIDLHGAYFLVYMSKNPTTIGLKGFVIQESKNTFRLLTKNNRILTIPKNETIFAFEHKEKIYKMNGYNMMMSSFNRSKIKPKYNFIGDL